MVMRELKKVKEKACSNKKSNIIFSSRLLRNIMMDTLWKLEDGRFVFRNYILDKYQANFIERLGGYTRDVCRRSGIREYYFEMTEKIFASFLDVLEIEQHVKDVKLKISIENALAS